MTIGQTTIDGNIATPIGDSATIPEDGIGGGILDDGGDAASLTNSTVDGNKSGAGGSGYVILGSTQTNTLLNDTITENTTTDPTGGSDIASGDTASALQVKNSIVSGGTPLDCTGKLTSLGSNLENGNTCGFTAAGDIVNRDPMLAALAANAPGGPPTRLPLKAGPVIDAVGGTCPPPAVDERGVTRPQPAGGKCDIGAVEVRAADLTSPTPTPTPAPSVAPISAPNSGGAPPPDPQGVPVGGVAAVGATLAGAIVLAGAGRRRRRH